jgi:hypothetical protein
MSWPTGFDDPSLEVENRELRETAHRHARCAGEYAAIRARCRVLEEALRHGFRILDEAWPDPVSNSIEDPDEVEDLAKFKRDARRALSDHGQEGTK